METLDHKRCPKCRGKGSCYIRTVYRSPNIFSDDGRLGMPGFDGDGQEISCNICRGLGWIESEEFLKLKLQGKI